MASKKNTVTRKSVAAKATKSTPKKVAKPKVVEHVHVVQQPNTEIRDIVKRALAKKAAEKQYIRDEEARRARRITAKNATSQFEDAVFENNSKDFAFAFAEQMKLAQLREAKKSQSEPVDDGGVKLTRRPTTRKQGQSTMKFSDSDLKEFRKALIDLGKTIVGKTATLKINALEQTIDRAGEDEDGSDSFMRLQNLGQVGEQNKTLQKIDEALHRIDDGTYGICDVCGQLIRKQRLLHLPFAHTCMECQRKMEARPKLAVRSSDDEE